ncbi:MAG: hypothetical protein AB2806_00905 [Candidatus Thiodiazotropha sp.]
MPRSKAKTPIHTDLTIAIDRHDVRLTAGHNLNLLGSNRHFIDDEELVFRFDSTIEMSGLCISPDKRAGDRYDITMISADPESIELTLKIKDTQERDKDGSPRYKKLKSGNYPVYKKPPSIGVLDKVRGEQRFTYWIWASPQMVTDCLILLSHYKQLYASILEEREARQRRVKYFTVQTTNPNE